MYELYFIAIGERAFSEDVLIQTSIFVFTQITRICRDSLDDENVISIRGEGGKI